jgi:hypothetical protein
MHPSTAERKAKSAKAALRRLRDACGVTSGPFTAADAERLIAYLFAEQIDECRLRPGKSLRQQGLTPNLLIMARTRPSKVGLKALMALAWRLDLAFCLGEALVEMKQACRLASPKEQRRWTSPSPLPDVQQILATVQDGCERIVRNDWSQAGTYLVALRAFSGTSLTSLAAELRESPLVLLRMELDEYRGEGPRCLREVHGALVAIANRIIG